MMVPLLRSTMPGRMARVMATRPLTLVAIMVSQSSSDDSWAGVTPSARPALLISTSMAPFGRQAVQRGRIEARSVTSSTIGGRVAQFGGQRLQAVFAAAADQHFVAVLGEDARHRGAEAGGGAGDEDDHGRSL
jgi:hypothetical protein